MCIAVHSSQGTRKERIRSTIPFRPALLALAIGQALLGMEAQAANFTVTDGGDSGAGTLRQAVIDAGANAESDSITFASGLSITLTSGEIPIVMDDVTIDGDLDDDGIPDVTVSVSNANPSRVFYLFQSIVALDGLTITGGNTGGGGGGIVNLYGDLSVTNSTISGNSADVGGGIFSYGKYGPNYGDATLTLNNSTVSGNNALIEGGGVINRADKYGNAHATINNSTVSGNSAGGDEGGIGNGASKYSNAQLIVNNSTVSGNSAVNDDGGIGNRASKYGTAQTIINNSTVSGNNAGNDGGGIGNRTNKYGYAQTTVTNSTISGNTAGSFGGGIENFGKYQGNTTLNVTGSTVSGNSSAYAGGGIDNYSKYSAPSANVTNSTISGNSAAGGGGVYSGGKYLGPNISTAVVTSVNSTIANNTATSTGGGLYAYNSLANASNTIIASAAGSSGDDCVGTLGTNVRNLIQDDSCGGVAALSGNPNLGPLQNNGGTTATHALLAGSIAIDAGSNGAASAAGLTEDQTGSPRVQGADVDIGAYEYRQAAMVPTMSQWVQSLFTVLLAGLGAFGLRRRRRKDSG